MNIKAITLSSALFIISSATAKENKKDFTVTEKSNLMARASYLLGRDSYETAKSQGIKLDLNAFKLGLEHAKNNEIMPFKDTVAVATMSELSEKIVKENNEKNQKNMNAEKEKGKKFLDENTKKDDVKTTSSGLQYKIIKAGEGKSPTATDNVLCHYEGKLLNGSKFDSSYDRGQPAQFGLNQVIPGWTEGVQLMKEGAKYEFYIPSDLAYGDAGAPPDIPGGATLIFTVELIKVNP